MPQCGVRARANARYIDEMRVGALSRAPSRGRIVLSALLVTAVISASVSCTVDPGTGALPAPTPKPFVKPATSTGGWSTTAQLNLDPATRKKVDALAALTLHQGPRRDPNAQGGWSTGLVPTVMAKMTGDDGQRTPEWNAFADLEKTISDDDAKALLHHEDPVIRVYFAGHVARTMEADAPALLYPLLLDNTEVHTRSGCIGEISTVGEIVVDDITEGDDGFGEDLRTGAVDESRADVMTTIVADDRISQKVRAKTLSSLAMLNPTGAHPFAIAALHGTDSTWRQEGAQALGSIHDPADIAAIGALTKSADPGDREAAARALGKMDSPAARDLLVPLIDDQDDVVRAAAQGSYAAQSSASDAVLTKLLNGFDSRGPSAVANALAERGTLHSLQLLAPTLMNADPKIDTMSIEGLIGQIGAPAIPITRDLLLSMSRNMNDVAMRKLGELGDKQSIPELRKLMREGQSTYLAADALGELDAKEAADDLVTVLTDVNPNSRIAAAKALVKIRAVQTLPALEKAASTDDTFAKPDIVKAALAMKAL